MNALLNLLLVAVLHNSASTPVAIALPTIHLQTDILMSSYAPPNRGVPGRRQGGGTR